MSMRYQAGIVLPGYNALKVANAPTIGTASVASGTSVSVAFTAPSCVGGGAISSYTAFACCGIKIASGASSPLTVTGLTTGQAYTFKVFATNAYGPSYPSAASNSVTPMVIGQQIYTTAGTYTWVAPSGVTSVSVVAIGGGTGAGGGLGYKNNYSVTPGNSYAVVVGQGIDWRAYTNTDSYFVSTSVVKGGGGGGIGCGGGTFTGDGGGRGGAGSASCTGYRGGGGAGGYSGNGGIGANPNFPGSSGAGGAGGGGGGSTSTGGGGGGGTGLFGLGSSGAGGASGQGGGGGSGGCAGGNGNVYCGTPFGAPGGAYGGGTGKGGVIAFAGSVGAVRIIWPGNTRQFPSTCVGNF